MCPKSGESVKIKEIFHTESNETQRNEIQKFNFLLILFET